MHLFLNVFIDQVVNLTALDIQVDEFLPLCLDQLIRIQNEP